MVNRDISSNGIFHCIYNDVSAMVWISSRMCSLFVWKIRSTSCRRSSNRSRDQTEGTRNRQIHIILLDHRIIILKTQCYRDKLRPVNNGFNKAIRFDNGIDRACARYALLSTFRWHTMIRTCIDAYCFYLCSPDIATFVTCATCRIYSPLLLGGRDLIIFHAIYIRVYIDCSKNVKCE